MCRGEWGERRHNCHIQITIIVNTEKGENGDWMDEDIVIVEKHKLSKLYE